MKENDEKKNQFLEDVISLFDKIYDNIDPNEPEAISIKKLSPKAIEDIVLPFKTYGPETKLTKIFRKKNELINTLIEAMCMKKSAEGEVRLRYLDVKDEILNKIKEESQKAKEQAIIERKLAKEKKFETKRKVFQTPVNTTLLEFYKDCSV